MMLFLAALAVLFIQAQAASRVLEAQHERISPNDVVIKEVMDYFNLSQGMSSQADDSTCVPGAVIQVGGYYQSYVYKTPWTDGAPGTATCDTSAPNVATSAVGQGFGCVSFCSTVGSSTPGSMWFDCGTVDGTVTLSPALFVGLNCDGGIFGGISGTEFAVTMPPCGEATDYLTFVCAADYVPASLSTGLRYTTFMNTDTCLGQPLSYTDTYNYGPTSYLCEDGNVESFSSSTNDTAVVQAVSCGSTPPVNNVTLSMGCGCITAMKSLTQRTFLAWDTTQNIAGLTVAALDIPNNVIALVTALVQVYGVDYSVIDAVKVVNGSASATKLQTESSSIDVQFSIMGQPGFGNAYNITDMYADIVAVHEAAIAADCATAATGCLLTIYQALATALGVPSESIASGLGIASSTPPTVVVNPNYPAPDTSSNAAAADEDSNGLGGGAIVGIIFGVAAAVAIGYYVCKQEKGEGDESWISEAGYMETSTNGDISNPMTKGILRNGYHTN